MYLTQFFVEDQARHGIAKVFESSARVAPNIPIQKTDALVYQGAKEVDLGEIAVRAINEAPPETKGSTTVPVNEKIILATSKIKVDYRMEMTKGGLRSAEAARRARQMGRWWDSEILLGTGATDKKRLSGLKERCAGNQLLTAGDNGAVLTLPIFESLIDSVEDFGGPKFVFTNKTISRKLKTLLLATAGGATVADVTGEIFTYEGWKIVPLDKNHLNTAVLPFTETQGSSNATTSLYAISTSAEERVGVKLLMASNSIELIEEGKRELQFIDYIELAFGLAVHDDRAAARLKGVKAA